MIALLFILPSTVFAQPQRVDSLVNVLDTQKLTPAEQLVIYEDICAHIGDDVEKFVGYTEKGLALAQKENDKAMIARFLINLGASYSVRGDDDRALVYYEKALVLALNVKNEKPILEATIYADMAVLYSCQFKHEEALEYYLKALAIFEKIGSKEGRMNILGNLAVTHIDLNNNEQAIYYLEQLKAMAEELNDKVEMCSVYLNFGHVYFNDGEVDKALEYFLKSLEISRPNRLRAEEMEALLALARIYSDELEDFDKAEEYADEVLHLAEEYASPSIVAARLMLAHIYLKQKRYKECDASAFVAWELDSVNIGNGMDAASHIVLANIFLGNTTKAAYFFKKYEDFVKQFNDESLHKSLSEMEVKYETEKKELRIAEMEKEKVFYIWLGIIGGILLLALLLLFIIRHRLAVNKQKLAEQQMQQVATQAVLDGETAERTRLARDLHDGLGGMLSVVKLNLDDLEHLQNAREMLDRSIDELRRVAHHMMPESLLRYGLKASLEDFCLSVPNAKFHYFGDDSRLEDRIEILIYRCTYELVNNAIKHSKASTINIQLIQDADRISLTVQDDGCGFDTAMVEAPNLGVSTGMGLENLRVRVAACKGNMTLYSSPGKGTEAYVELKVES
jgi:signal transduction histidine kinase